MTYPLISRRSLIFGGIGAAVLLVFGGATKYSFASNTKLLRPPGGQDEAHLNGLCIRCDRCRQACPMKAIESATVEDGAINVRTPKMNYRSHALQRTLGTTEYHKTETGYCNFCDPEQNGLQTKKCIANCPTGALLAFDEKRERLGEAVIDPIYCINYPQLGQTPTGCRLCVDACPYEAIVVNDEQRPEVIPNKCNGCGKCELVCPSATYRQLIGADTLLSKVESGSTNYANSLEFYQQTGKIPRGINICYRAETVRA